MSKLRAYETQSNGSPLLRCAAARETVPQEDACIKTPQDSMTISRSPSKSVPSSGKFAAGLVGRRLFLFSSSKSVHSGIAAAFCSSPKELCTILSSVRQKPRDRPAAWPAGDERRLRTRDRRDSDAKQPQVRRRPAGADLYSQPGRPWGEQRKKRLTQTAAGCAAQR
jgi:hypothetical protein